MNGEPTVNEPHLRCQCRARGNEGIEGGMCDGKEELVTVNLSGEKLSVHIGKISTRSNRKQYEQQTSKMFVLCWMRFVNRKTVKQ